ncbi:unnamed protein product [Caenorhabditis nigoni]
MSSSDELDGERSVEAPKAMKRRANYDISFKSSVVSFALKFDISKAAKNFGISRSCVHDWIKQKEVLKEKSVEQGPSKRKRLEGAGRHLNNSEFDSKLKKWIREQRKEKLRVCRSMIQRQAKRLNQDPTFQASNGWLQRFLKRHNLVSRRATTVCQKTPEMYTSKLIDFVLFVEKTRTQKQYSSILACDETAVYLDWSNSMTVETKGVSEVSVRTTGHDKMHVTVMLCAKDDGYKCRPFVLPPDVFWNAPFKSKIRQSYEEWMTYGIKTYTKSGNMRAPPMDLYLQWIDDAWKSLPDELIKKSFKGCALTTVPGGSEDHLIHCFKANSGIPSGLDALTKARMERSLEELEDMIEEVDLSEEEYQEDSDSSLIFD